MGHRKPDPKHKPSKKEERPTRPEWAHELGDREYVFVTEYLVDLDATKAMRRAGFVMEGQSDGRQRAWDMKHRPVVARAIDKAIQADASGPRQWLVTKLRAIIEANHDDFFEWDDSGFIKLKPGSQVPREMRGLIKEIVVDADGAARLKLHDPMRAMEILAKIGALSLQKDTVAVDGETLEALLLAAGKIREAKRDE